MVERARKSGRQNIDSVQWDIECRVSAIANDFINDDLARRRIRR